MQLFCFLGVRGYPGGENLNVMADIKLVLQVLDGSNELTPAT